MPVPSANPEVEALRKEVKRLRELLEKEKVPQPKKGTEEPKKGTQEELSAPIREPKYGTAGESPTPISSRVTVTLPRDARLWVENVECPLTSSVRSFNTPPLKAGQQYFYNLRVEVVRDGRTVSETQRVVITPGQEARVDFNSAALGTAAR